MHFVTWKQTPQTFLLLECMMITCEVREPDSGRFYCWSKNWYNLWQNFGNHVFDIWQCRCHLSLFFHQKFFMKGRLKMQVLAQRKICKIWITPLLHKLVKYVIVCEFDCLSNAAENKTNQQVWLIGDLALSRCYPGPCLHVLFNLASPSTGTQLIESSTGNNIFKGL